MAKCAAVGKKGELQFVGGSDEWYVNCPECGARWVGGGPVLVDHEDRRAARWSV
ncbi:hypothetical protein [Rhodococcus opacus]|uniref:hypothetical protein n=1 Tax=Rhodococcus opacus TaxID=37919 RepID=UPI00031D0E2F|nr:hypothetical protein [Rhodococcus opacus]